MIESSRLGDKSLSYRGYRSSRSGPRFFALRPIPAANQKGQSYQTAIKDGTLDSAFDQPVVMHYTGDRADVDQPVQELPALSAQPADRGGGGGEGQRDHQHERGEARGDEGPLDEVVQNVLPE